MSLRSALKRVPGLRPAVLRAREVKDAAIQRIADIVTYERMPAPLAVEMGYEVMLGEHPALRDVKHHVAAIASGALSRQDFIYMLRGSESFPASARYSGELLGFSIHSGRCQFIKMLPRATRILDLGGVHQQNPIGALVALGYPYDFDELIIVDLPTDERHAIYQKSSDRLAEVKSPRGPVRYQYHSMTDLSAYGEGSFGLVYSGQSIEHVTRAEADIVLSQVYRVLERGGWFALDTPNARVTRMQQEAFIDPDHKHEYQVDELHSMLERVGFTDIRTMGLNYAGDSLTRSSFDLTEVARHPGIYDEAADCYILCLICRKPA